MLEDIRLTPEERESIAREHTIDIWIPVAANTATDKAIKKILQTIGCLLWVDDDSKTSGLLVTGSVFYSEWQVLKKLVGEE